MSFATDFFADYEKQRADDLANAERDAAASGKELFDLARLEAILNRGPQAAREKDHQMNYYLLHAKFRTLAEYATWLIDSEPFEDAR
ncbi:MAG: hypothetical protein NT062_15965 [Proteobacteria bacterium]|nr:hypothetical protein [Pseudomonadota bacterium]